jgi:phage replication O-like protein O
MSFKIAAPEYTQIPNALIDEWLPQLTAAETKVVLVIMRKTFGWHKIRDRISLSQLEKFTGFLRQAVLKAVKSLEEKNLVTKTVIGKNGDQQTFYELVIEDSNNSYQCVQHTPPSVFNTPTKETLTKETPLSIDKGEGGGAPPDPLLPLFKQGDVAMLKESYDKLVSQHGKEAVDETVKELELYAKIDPKKFKRYKNHGAVVEVWIRRNMKKTQKKTPKPENSWTKKYTTSVTDSNVNTSEKDTQELVSLGSLLEREGLKPY